MTGFVYDQCKEIGSFSIHREWYGSGQQATRIDTRNTDRYLGSLRASKNWSRKLKCHGCRKHKPTKYYQMLEVFEWGKHPTRDQQQVLAAKVQWISEPRKRKKKTRSPTKPVKPTMPQHAAVAPVETKSYWLCCSKPCTTKGDVFILNIDGMRCAQVIRGEDTDDQCKARINDMTSSSCTECHKPRP